MDVVVGGILVEVGSCMVVVVVVVGSRVVVVVVGIEVEVGS